MDFTFESGERDRRDYVRWARWSAAVYCGLLLLATHWPRMAKLPSHGSLEWDKAAHFVAYGILAALLMWVWRSRQRGTGPKSVWAALRAGVLVVFAASLLGIFDETTQPLTGREFDWYDWVADTLGATCGVSGSILAGIGMLNDSRRSISRDATSQSPCSTVADSP